MTCSACGRPCGPKTEKCWKCAAPSFFAYHLRVQNQVVAEKLKLKARLLAGVLDAHDSEALKVGSAR